MDGFSRDQKLIIKGLHGYGDGKEKARHINEIFKWKIFYQKYFGKDHDILTDVSIPPRPPEGDWRLLVVYQALGIWEMLRLCWNLDGRQFTKPQLEEQKLSASTIFSSSEDIRMHPYAKWIPDRRYATKQAMEERGLTVQEFLLDELLLFEESGRVNTYESCQMVVLQGSKYFDESHPIAYRSFPEGHLHIHSENFFEAVKCRLG